jgi:hypothetical protein
VTRVVLLSATAVLFLAGCGGDESLTKADYSAKVRSVYAGVQQAFQRTDVPPDQLPDRVVEAQDALRDAAGELEAVDPPEDVRAEHAQIAEGMRAYADDLDVLREAAERGDERAIASFNERVGENAAVKRIAEAAERMKFKGYDLGQIAEE